MLILHLSDIHFKASDAGHVMDHNQLLRNELEKDIREMFQSLGAPPDLIILTGDIAFAGISREYEFATTWLKKLCDDIGADYKNIVVVPGNHDVNRSVSSSDEVQNYHNQIKAASPAKLYDVLKGFLDNAESAAVLYRSIADYNEFASQFFCNLFPPFRTTVKRDFILNDGSTLRITGLNSSFVSSRFDGRPDLFVDHSFNQILNQDGIVNLVVCHHPYEWLRNGTELKRHLRRNAKLQLFGHEHTQRYEMNRDWILTSASATQPDHGSEWEPGYNIMEVSVQGHDEHRTLVTKAYFRIWQENPIQFVAKMDGKKDHFEHKIDLEKWTPEIIVDQAKSTELITASTMALEEPTMASLRDVAINFSQLTVSQKNRIAKKLGLYSADDDKYPDFERFTRILTRAKDQNLVEELNKEIAALNLK